MVVRSRGDRHRVHAFAHARARREKATFAPSLSLFLSFSLSLSRGKEAFKRRIGKAIAEVKMGII